MTNKEKYHFTDFTLEEYKSLLQIPLKKGFIFRGYTDYQPEEKFVLWRHDIDFCPVHALRLAQIENQLNIKATYFFLLHADFYNLLSEENKIIIQEIVRLGHEVGIHFDHSYYKAKSLEQLEEKLEFEKMIYKESLNVTPKAFSFHNPDNYILTLREYKYANLVNTYAAYFQENVSYCSDSNGYWRFKRMKDFLNEDHKKLQILTHPGWWQEEIMSPYERVTNILKARGENLLLSYENFLRSCGRENIKE